MERTTIFYSQDDRAALQAIKDRYGITTDADAVRLALRLAAAAKLTVQWTPPKGKVA
jgi:hypothetical protein